MTSTYHLVRSLSANTSEEERFIFSVVSVELYQISLSRCRERLAAVQSRSRAGEWVLFSISVGWLSAQYVCVCVWLAQTPLGLREGSTESRV